MNVRQSGALTELIRKEELARSRWEASNTQDDGYAYDEPDDYSHQTYQMDNSIPDAHTIYDRAMRISSPRVVDDGSEIPQFVQRKVVRQVEVPFTREVKVPVKTRKIVPTRVQKRVKTTKLVEVPAFKMVDETYTDIVEQPAIREREVWVKKIVPEKYMQKVPVKRTRQVQVPTTVIKEVDDWEVVEVSGSKAIEVDGYRVDQVEDSKVVEVEEYQTYKLEPTAYGPARIDNAYDVGIVEGVHHSRKVGSQVYHMNDHRVNDLPMDDLPDKMSRMTVTHNPRAPRSQSTKTRGRPERTSMPESRRPETARPQPLGLKLSDTASHNCVSVTQVNRGSPSEQGGVRKGDLICYVNNRPTRNLREFREAVENAQGHLNMQIRRLGGVKVTVVIVR